MLVHVMPLYGSFLEEIFVPYLIPVFCLAFIATIPCIIRAVVRGY